MNHGRPLHVWAMVCEDHLWWQSQQGMGQVDSKAILLIDKTLPHLS